MLYEGLYQTMIANPALSAIVGSRVLQSVLPLNFAVPAVTYTVVNSKYAGVDVGAKSVLATESLVDISAWASTYHDAAYAIQAIHGLFDLYTGALPDGTNVLFTDVQSIPDMFEDATRLYRCSVTLRVIHTNG
jgi:hypothetical protein